MIVICSDATHIETVSSGDEPCQEVEVIWKRYHYLDLNKTTTTNTVITTLGLLSTATSRGVGARRTCTHTHTILVREGGCYC